MSELNEEQRAAVESDAANIMCMAGPGSGKTRTLIERVAWLVNGGCDPRAVVCITFTNAASDEMKTRLLERGIVIRYCGTLHSYCMSLLRELGASIGLPPAIVVLDDKQREAMLQQVIAELRVKASIKKVDAHIAGDQLDHNTKAEVLLVLSAYNRRCMDSGMLDFDALLTQGLRLLETAPIASLDALLVDEFQDSSALDAQIYAAIQTLRRFYVGDQYQAIYSFRGGDWKQMVKLARSDDFEAVPLKNNYRCDQMVCQLANDLLQGVATVSISGGSGLSQILTSFFDPLAQFQHIAEDIKAGQRETAFEDCAVLVRTNKQVDAVAQALTDRGVPVMKRVMEQKPADWAKCRLLVNLLVNPENDLLAYWWLEATRGEAFAKDMRMKSLAQHASINRNFMHISPPPVGALDEILDVLVRYGFSVESVARVRKALDMLPSESSLSDLSAKLGAEDLWRIDSGTGVKVLTAHASKGTEHDVCYVPCLNEGLWPMKRDDESEARRLLYVAVTRSRHKIVLMCGQKIPDWNGKLIDAEPSRFIKELQQ